MRRRRNGGVWEIMLLDGVLKDGRDAFVDANADDGYCVAHGGGAVGNLELVFGEQLGQAVDDVLRSQWPPKMCLPAPAAQTTKTRK